MSHETPAEEDILTLEELSELLADVEGTTPEEIEALEERIDDLTSFSTGAQVRQET